jgi:hypothetical protein
MHCQRYDLPKVTTHLPKVTPLPKVTTHLHHCQHIWQCVLCLIHWAQQHVQLVRRSISQQQQVVRGVLVVARHQQRNNLQGAKTQQDSMQSLSSGKASAVATTHKKPLLPGGWRNPDV